MSSIKFILSVLSVIVLISCSKDSQSDSNSQINETNELSNENHPPQGKRPEFPELLNKMDANKDLKLSEAEVEGPLKDIFAQIDENKDGVITEDEFKNAPRMNPPNRQ